MPLQYHCPNCKAVILSTAPNCGACGALFADHASWKPIAKAEAEDPPPTGANLVLAAIGVALLVGTFFPVGAQVVQAFALGTYGPVFTPVPPALVILLAFAVDHLPWAVLAGLLCRYFKVMKRIPYKYRSPRLLGSGIVFFLIYLSARVGLTVMGSFGGGFAVIKLLLFVWYSALALLMVGVIRLCVGFGKSVAA